MQYINGRKIKLGDRALCLGLGLVGTVTRLNVDDGTINLDPDVGLMLVRSPDSGDCAHFDDVEAALADIPDTSKGAR